MPGDDKDEEMHPWFKVQPTRFELMLWAIGWMVLYQVGQALKPLGSILGYWIYHATH